MPTSEDRYPLSLLAGFELMPTGSGNGVMAVCRRHEGEVSALLVNSISDAPLLGSLAFMAGEHESEHHGGPAMPDDDDEAFDPDQMIGPDDILPSTGTRPDVSEGERPWCGARKELGGQQPCPLAVPCDGRTCQIGSADGNEVYRPATAPNPAGGDDR